MSWKISFLSYLRFITRFSVKSVMKYFEKPKKFHFSVLTTLIVVTGVVSAVLGALITLVAPELNLFWQDVLEIAGVFFAGMIGLVVAEEVEKDVFDNGEVALFLISLTLLAVVTKPWFNWSALGFPRFIGLGLLVAVESVISVFIAYLGERFTEFT